MGGSIRHPTVFCGDDHRGTLYQSASNFPVAKASCGLWDTIPPRPSTAPPAAIAPTNSLRPISFIDPLLYENIQAVNLISPISHPHLFEQNSRLRHGFPRPVMDPAHPFKSSPKLCRYVAKEGRLCAYLVFWSQRLSCLWSP